MNRNDTLTIARLGGYENGDYAPCLFMPSTLDSICLPIPEQRRLFDQNPPHPDLRVSVIIPAKNEADTLTKTLDALRCQEVDGVPFPNQHYEVLLLLNNCTDQSDSVARWYQQHYPDFKLWVMSIQLPAEQANVGTARRLLMDAACQRFGTLDRPLGIIASTDGDTLVARNWIAQIIAEINKGCDAVGGRILSQPNGNSVRRNHLLDVTYRTLIARIESLLDPLPFDPWPRHFQHFGASLALTCEAYQRVGGLPQVPYLEDEALYRALLRIDARIRRSPNVCVTTSARLQGRVAVGFSEQLRYWERLNQTNQIQLVECADAIITRIQARSRLRVYWAKHAVHQPRNEIQSVAMDLGIDPVFLQQQLERSHYFGQCWERVEAQLAATSWASRWELVPIVEATAQLRQWQNKLDSLSGQSASLARVEY